jgi:hypothetical protein
MANPTQTDRRRSQRVHLAIPVEVGWTQEDGSPVSEHAETEVLNAYGALLRMKPHLPIPIDVELSKPREGLSTPARVVGFRKPTPKGLLGVAVELAAPSQTFWGISFPPVPSTSAS